MKGDKKVIAHLNVILKNELTAINQYFLHSRMLKDWGMTKLGEKEYEESIDEMEHIAHKDLKDAIEYSESVRDYVSRDLLSSILVSEEEHVDWLETQLSQLENMGLQNYVQLQSAAAE